jgi:uncharacterized membrane protein
MLTGRQSLPIIAAQGLIAFVVLVAATFLAYSDKLEGEAVTALFGMAIALAGQTAGATALAVSGPPGQTPTRVTTPEGVTVETNGAVSPPAPNAETP